MVCWREVCRAGAQRGKNTNGGAGMGWPHLSFKEGQLNYMVKAGARLPVSPQVAGKTLQRLADKNMLTPRNLVEESRPKDAPLHKCFEWDDTVAAERWRETQAAYIIRSITVTVEESEEPTRAFVATISDGSHVYEEVGVVLRRADSREMLLQDAKREMVAFQRKYKQLSELSGVFKSMDEFVRSLLDGESDAA